MKKDYNDIEFYIKNAENRLNNGLRYCEEHFEGVIEDFMMYDNVHIYDIDITWDDVKDELIRKGWKYCCWDDCIVTDEYAKEIGLLDDDDDV